MNDSYILKCIFLMEQIKKIPVCNITAIHDVFIVKASLYSYIVQLYRFPLLTHALPRRFVYNSADYHVVITTQTLQRIKKRIQKIIWPCNVIYYNNYPLLFTHKRVQIITALNLFELMDLKNLK